ncbi:MAG: ABC transporter ATP-binding protein [Caldilineaceae bacterium]|nr:ABC transporter ATP-binding protein [Caldilineaceae bacterium]MCB0124598.1 ABC transporter ATP-binding protein [Caldilineaceae bacterium]
MTQTNDIILDVKDLHTYFFTESGQIRALSGVDFALKRGEVLGIVGESGCGKSVTAQCIMNMVPNPGRIMGGEITYHRRSNGQTEQIDIVRQHPRGRVMRSIRGNEIAMIFQEPMTSLDPVYTVGSQLMEAITLHQNVSKAVAREIGEEALGKVHLPEPHRIFDSYPHQLSGGQRQRVMIAIALSCNPSLLIADEPTTALDVTTQAQILDLMQELQEATNMSIIFITHDLGVVAEMCDSVAVMYLGKVVEKTDIDSAFYAPKHPYTKALLRSIPRLDAETHNRLAVIHGNVPDPSVVPTGCPFHPRCPEFVPGLCNTTVPAMVTLESQTEVRCLLYDKERAPAEERMLA